MKQLLILIALALTACGGGSSSPSSGTATNLQVTCADVSNDGTGCMQAAINIVRGDISRSESMWLSARVDNQTVGRVNFYYEIRLNPGCNGEVNWLSTSSNTFLDPGQAATPAQSLQCSGQPLGQTTMEFIAYANHATTVCQEPEEIDPDIGQQCFTTINGPEIDRATVTYNVIE